MAQERKRTSRKTELSGQREGMPGGSALAGRSMPESLAAEAAVLGSMLIDAGCIGGVIEVLKGSQAFYRVENQLIFDAIVSLYDKNRGEGIDAVLLRDELERRKELVQVGGEEYIARILDSVPSSANIEHYTKILKDKMLLRDIITASGEILQTAYDGSMNTAEALDLAEQKIFAVTNKCISNSAVALKDLVTQAYEAIEEHERGVVTGVPTGFYELDDVTCGMQRGDMIVVAGRPSMGKTAFALNIAEHVGVREKKAVALFSLEMSKEQLAQRCLCTLSEVDFQAVRRGVLTTEDYEKLVVGCGQLAAAEIYIDDTAAMTPLELRAKARRLKSRHNIEFAVVDYLQLMDASNRRSESRQQEITEISRQLKALARELEIPIMVISQLNRATEAREDHRPRMSDLRESGSIEQDADVVILLHREDYYNKTKEEFEPTNKAEVIIAKQRNGPTGKVELVFREQFTRFENLARVEQPF